VNNARIPLALYREWHGARHAPTAGVYARQRLWLTAWAPQSVHSEGEGYGLLQSGQTHCVGSIMVEDAA
jgi:hypothetical protein